MKTFNPIDRKLILGLLSLAVLLPSCSKDDEEELSVKTKLLTQGAWKMTALTIDPGSVTFDKEGNVIGYDNDFFAILDQCTKDDTYLFNTDKSMVTDEGLTKCNSSAPQKIYETWSFNTDETMLTITDQGELLTGILVELSKSTLKLKSTETVGGDTFTHTLTFSH